METSTGKTATDNKLETVKTKKPSKGNKWNNVKRKVETLMESGEDLMCIRYNKKTKSVDVLVSEKIQKIVSEDLINSFVQAAGSVTHVPVKKDIPFLNVCVEELNINALRCLVGEIVRNNVKDRLDILRGFWGIRNLAPEWYPAEVPFSSPNDGKSKYPFPVLEMSIKDIVKRLT